MKSDLLEIEPATCQSQVQRPTAAPPHQVSTNYRLKRSALVSARVHFSVSTTRLSKKSQKGI